MGQMSYAFRYRSTRFGDKRPVILGFHSAKSHLTAPHRTAPHRTAPHRTAPHRTAPHRTAPHRTAPHRTAPRGLSQNKNPEKDRGASKSHYLCYGAGTVRCGAVFGGFYRTARHRAIFSDNSSHGRKIDNQKSAPRRTVRFPNTTVRTASCISKRILLKKTTAPRLFYLQHEKAWYCWVAHTRIYIGRPPLTVTNFPSIFEKKKSSIKTVWVPDPWKKATFTINEVFSYQV